MYGDFFSPANGVSIFSHLANWMRFLVGVFLCEFCANVFISDVWKCGFEFFGVGSLLVVWKLFLCMLMCFSNYFDVFFHIFLCIKKMDL